MPNAKLVKRLMKVIIDTGLKKNCCISSEFKKTFLDDLREQGYGNLATLIEYLLEADAPMKGV